MKVSLAAALLNLFSLCDNARILVFEPINSRSHSIVMDSLFEELASRGHQVTVVTSFPHKTPVPNLTEIDVSHTQHMVVSNVSLDNIKELMPNPFVTTLSIQNIEFTMCEQVVQEDAIQKLLKSDTKVDLVMTEAFAADCFIPFAHKHNAPLIQFVTSITLPWVTDRVGFPDNPSYIVNYFLGFPPEMTYFQRIYNSAVYAYTKLVHTFYVLPKVQRFVTEHFGDSIPPIEKMLKNTSMLFVNGYFALSQSRPFPPNVLEIGGIHIGNSTNPMPKDIQSILDSSPQGVIVMSFGSMVKVSSIPRHVISTFMRVFSTLPQKILFKYEENLPEAPSNVIIRKWLPQKELLSHKNVKAVIAHGGLASTIEAVHFGKPFIGIPFYCDQYNNVNSVARHGAGVVLQLEDVTELSVREALTNVLENPKYKEGMKRLSLQFRDRPMTALQSAVYWTEYVIRHKGAPHLRPASVSLPLYQYLLLDVIALLLTALTTTLYILYRLTKKCVQTFATVRDFNETNSSGMQTT